MPKPLRPGDVLRPIPIQVATLGDGRLLVRGPAGIAALAGVARGDVERVAAAVDGVRTAGEVCAELAGEVGERDAVRVLRLLAGLGPETGAATPAGAGEAVRPAPDRLRVLGDGPAARRIARRLGTAVVPPHLGDEGLGSLELAVCALEDASYRRLFDLQRALLEAGVVSLFVTFDADGARIGPSVVPGAGPCLACVQLAGFRALEVDASDLLAAVADFRTGRAAPGSIDAVARRAAAEAAALAAGRPALLTSVRLLGRGGETTFSVTPAADCPLCGSISSRHPLAARARRELAEVHRRAPRLALGDGGNGDGDLCASVGILGGGTAGYLAALALRRRFPRLPVTLIESSSVPVIGVGEATTPLMPQFLHVDLGLSVRELFREVRPTLKLGIRFEWGRPGGAFHYPFGPLHVLEPEVYDGDLLGCSQQSLLMSAGAVGLYPESPDFGNGAWRSELDVDVAYHLDNRRFVRYLKKQAAAFGVETVDARIVDVEVADGRETVTALVVDDGRRFASDLYVDASGFRSLLMGKALGSPFVSYGDSLFTDRAVIATVPYEATVPDESPADGAIPPYTTAETMSAGWCWSTPQRDADHRGYVFCSAFQDAEAAEREMRAANPGMGDARLVTFRAGRHRHFWRGNVVALGNAYGFVEPLESTALHLLIRQIGLLLGALPVRRGERGAPAVANRRVGAFWDYLRWFLALHYRFNRRLDTPFWRHCRREVDVSGHGELLELFRDRGPLSYQRSAASRFDYPDPLWGPEGIDVVLLGQGVPSRLPRPAASRREWAARLSLARAAVRQAAPQAPALEALDRRSELLERWVEAFRRVGPAFPAE